MKPLIHQIEHCRNMDDLRRAINASMAFEHLEFKRLRQPSPQEV